MLGGKHNAVKSSKTKDRTKESRINIATVTLRESQISFAKKN